LKVVFWSHVRGRCGTTMHMACVAVAQALFADSRVVMMENHEHLINIENCFVKMNGEGYIKDCSREYNVMGLENLMERFAVATPAEEKILINRCAMPFVQDKLYYLPHGYLRNGDLLDYEFCNNMVHLFDGLEKHFDKVFIDAFATESLATKSIIESADLVIVNLNQNRSILDHFFRNFANLRNKAIFILGNYNSGMSNGLTEIRRKYQIARDRIYAVPFCMEAAESESDGSLVNFIARNYMEPTLPNRDFINAIRSISDKLTGYSHELAIRHRLGLG